MPFRYIEILRKPLLLTQPLDDATEKKVLDELALAKAAPKLLAALEKIERLGREGNVTQYSLSDIARTAISKIKTTA